MNKIFFSLLVLSLSLHATLYQVNNTKSYIGFGVKNLLLPYTEGQFGTYRGSFSYDEEKGFFLSLDGEVDVDSINTQSEGRDEHLRSDDFFGVKEYPNMTLRLIRQHKEHELLAMLTIRGISKPVVFEISDILTDAPNAKGEVKKTFTLKSTINRIDFDVKYNSFFGMGEQLIDNMVDVKLIIEGINKSKFD